MYEISDLNQEIEDLITEKPVTVKSIVISLVLNAQVVDFTLATALITFARQVKATTENSLMFSNVSLYNALHQILNSAKLPVPAKVAVHAGIVYKKAEEIEDEPAA